MKYYIIAGEASGDLHASNLMKQIRIKDPEARFRCWGGDMMKNVEGAELVKHYRDLAFMGFTEVLFHLRTITGNIRFCKDDIKAFSPDVVILVDYPGFNLRIARFAHTEGIKVFYYISPQLWAWHSSRVKTVKETVDRMFVILPFEKDFYRKYDYEVDFISHPLLDVINEHSRYSSREEFLQKNKIPDKPIIALLPGSRKQEIRTMLRTMLTIAPHFPDHQILVAGAPSQPGDFYRKIIQDPAVGLICGQTYDLLHHSRAALVTSGTATLETALLGVPQVVCYKGNHLSYLIAKQIINVKYISLVNLIMDKIAVKELIQGDLITDNLVRELSVILQDGPGRSEILNCYKELYGRLGGVGASEKAAGLMVQYMKKSVINPS